VRRTLVVDGREESVRDVARNPELAGLISDEGPLEWPKY
jgi:hypothetical protein